MSPGQAARRDRCHPHEGQQPMLAVLAEPLIFMAKFAQKVQAVATQVARSAAKVAQTAARSAAKMANTAAKIQARALARQEARALQATLKRPSVVFLREVRHGQTSVAFYRRID